MPRVRRALTAAAIVAVLLPSAAPAHAQQPAAPPAAPSAPPPMTTQQPAAPEPGPDPRPGRVRVSGRALADDRGEFAGLGASLFWAAWAYRHDPARLDDALFLLASHRVDYIRALGTVGLQPYWAGRETDPRWPDYADVIANLTDHAYDNYGLRVEWTIFGDAQVMAPTREDRVRVLEAFLAMSVGREHKIVHFELANESWQNGFGGPDGIAQLRELAAYLAEKTDIPVAISDAEGHGCEDHLVLYRDMPVEILTEHVSRIKDGPERDWGPAVRHWDLGACTGLPPVRSSNEPIGPGSSVESESDPLRIVGHALAAFLSQVGLYVFHTEAGVFGRVALADTPQIDTTLDGLAALKRYLPPDIVNWRPHRHGDPGHPFVAWVGDTRNALGTDGHVDGAVEVFASVKENRFVAVPLGIVNGLTLEAQQAMRFDVLHPLTGETLERHELAPGAKVRLRALPVLVLIGEFVE